MNAIRSLPLAALSLTLFVAACKRHDPSRATARARSHAAFSSSGSDGFDLALTADGAMLVRVSGASIVARRLTGSGDPVGPDRTVYETSTEITDLRALGVGARVAVVWSERVARPANPTDASPQSTDGRLRVMWLGSDAAVTLTPRDLGPTQLATLGSRGNLALAARSGEALAFARGADEACVDSPGRCARFSFYQLEHPDQREMRRLPLIVPNPCAVNSALFAVTDNRWYYAVCNEVAGEWKTTAFLIQYEPQYARAEQAFSDCTPIGAAVVDGDLVVTGDCAGTRRAIELGAIEAEPIRFDLADEPVGCTRGHPTLRVGPRHATTSLDEPRADVAALLPAAVMPRDARAVWTGRALLVAENRAPKLAISVLACEGDRLRAADPR